MIRPRRCPGFSTMSSRYLITLGLEEFVPEGGIVTDVVWDDQTETIMIEYEAPALVAAKEKA